jgi:hypothetical protein
MSRKIRFSMTAMRSSGHLKVLLIQDYLVNIEDFKT